MLFRAKLLRGLLLFVISYSIFFLGIVLGSCADRLLLHPSVAPIAAVGMQRKTFAYNDSAIEAWTYRSLSWDRGGSKLWVLEFVGNAARAERGGILSAEDWGDHSVEVWTVNYPGFGGSGGEADLDAIPPVALAAYDRIAAVAKSSPILVIGNSLGTTAALHVAANRKVAGVVLRNPPPLQNQILLRHGWWNLWLVAFPVVWQIPSELNSLENAPRVNAPSVFILSQKDDVVPYAYQQKVLEAYGGPRQVLFRANARHNTPLSPDERKRFLSMLHQLLGTVFRTLDREAS